MLYSLRRSGIRSASQRAKARSCFGMETVVPAELLFMRPKTRSPTAKSTISSAGSVVTLSAAELAARIAWAIRLELSARLETRPCRLFYEHVLRCSDLSATRQMRSISVDQLPLLLPIARMMSSGTASVTRKRCDIAASEAPKIGHMARWERPALFSCTAHIACSIQVRFSRTPFSSDCSSISCRSKVLEHRLESLWSPGGPILPLWP